MRYTPGLGGRIASFVMGLILTALAAIAIPKIGIDGILGIRTQWILVGTMLVIAVIGVVLTVSKVFVTGPVTIVTSPTHVELHRGGRLRERWDRATTQFSSYVVRQRTNGVPSGSVRQLIVTTAGERVEVTLPWFAGSTFNALIADVAPQVPATLPGVAAPAAAPAAPVPSSGTFTVDHGPLIRTRTAGVVIIVVTLVAVGVLAGVLAMDEGITEITVVLGGIALLVAVLVGALTLRGRGVPRTLTVSPASLQVDDRTFLLDGVTNIAATPPGYAEIGGRTLTLLERDGRRTVVKFGTTGDKTFPDYARFLETLRAATTHRPGVFTLDVA